MRLKLLKKQEQDAQKCGFVDHNDSSVPGANDVSLEPEIVENGSKPVDNLDLHSDNTTLEKGVCEKSEHEGIESHFAGLSGPIVKKEEKCHRTTKRNRCDLKPASSLSQLVNKSLVDQLVSYALKTNFASTTVDKLQYRAFLLISS